MLPHCTTPSHYGTHDCHPSHSVLFGSRTKLNSQITTFKSQQQILLLALPLPSPPVFNFLHILLLTFFLFLPPSYLLELPLPHPDLIKKFCCCGRKVVIKKFSFFLLPSKTEWALVTGVHPCCSRSPNLFHPRSTHSNHMDSSVNM